MNFNWTDLDNTLDVIEQLRNTGSTKEKGNILKANVNDEALQKVLTYTYDSFKRYGISEEVYNNNPICTHATIYQKPYEMFNELASSNINDILREKAKYFIEVITPEQYRELIKGILFKDLKLGVNAKSINKVWKGLIPTFDVQLAESFSKKQPKENEYFYLTTKIDGCFAGTTHVTMADGTYKYIKDIQVGDYVLSFNEQTKELSNQKVTNVFNNGRKSKEQWVKLLISQNGDGLGMKKSVSVTKNHKFFTPNGWKQAGELSVGDKFYSYDYVPSQTQIDVLAGILFGDGSTMFDSEKGKNTRFFYAQKEGSLMCGAIKNLFNNIIGEDKNYVSGYGSKMKGIRIKTIHELPKAFYNRNNILKTSFLPTKETLELLSPLALAVWYMDDGNKGQSQEDGDNVANIKTRAKLSTYRYPYDSLLKMKAFLEGKYGITGALHKYKDTKDGENFGYQFDLTAEGTDRLFQLIAPYILPDKKYKISKKYRDVPFIDWTKDCGSIQMVERVLVGIDEDKPLTKGLKLEQRAYDIEVENNHTYFANGCAVHNCRLLGLPNEQGIYEFYSRKGELQEGLDHLQPDCQRIGQGIFVLDGELIARNDNNLPSGELYKVTSKIARKKGKTAEKARLEFHVFDIVEVNEFKQGRGEATYHQRRELLDNLFEQHKNELYSLKKVEVLYQGIDQSMIPTITKELEEQGYEGTMINIGTAKYECKRHSGILKVKSFKSGDFYVKSVFEGTGRLAGKLGGITIQYLHNGELHECDLGTGFVDSERELYWNNPELIVGKVVECQYFEVSQNANGGIGLRFPSWLNRIRDDKDFDTITDVALQ